MSGSPRGRLGRGHLELALTGRSNRGTPLARHVIPVVHNPFLIHRRGGHGGGYVGLLPSIPWELVCPATRRSYA